jgi:hypothetical protein
MTGIRALSTHARLTGAFMNLLTVMMEIRVLLTHARLTDVFMNLLTVMMEIRALLTRALLAGVFMSQYFARKTCIWESMPGMESTG